MKRGSTKRQPRIKHVVRDADVLGCHRNHLRLVIQGRRISKSLLARYEALKASQAQPAAEPPGN